MALNDVFGAPVSHRNQADVDAFSAAATLMLGYAPDPVGMIKETLKHAPDFIMAHCFLGGVYLIASDKNRQKNLQKQYDILTQLAAHANEREGGHIQAIKLWLEGDLYASSQAYSDILLQCPRDLPALQFGHQLDFLLGQSSSNRDRPSRVMKYWSKADSEYSFILGMQAFGLEESGHYPQGEAMALECVATNSNDTWGVHALAHCYEMQGKTEQGIRFMQNCEDKWAGDNYMSVHNRWHLGLFWLEQCNFDLALSQHDQYMQVNPKSELMDVHDSAAMLWRLGLYGVNVGDRWKPVADRYTDFIDQAYMPFNDMHAMMAFVATGREKEANALVAALSAKSDANKTASMIINTVGLPIVKAIQAFGLGEHAFTKSTLSSVRHCSHLIGGSVAQRDIINLTLLASANRSHDKAMMSGLISERMLMKPASPLTDLLK